MLHLSRIYPITDTALSGCTHAELVSEFAAAGASLVQIRDKKASPGEFYRNAAEAVLTGRRLGVKIIINDRLDIAIATDADGVHLGQDDIPPEEARRLLGPDKIIGYSTHSVEQAQRAANLQVDYIAFGPVFVTKTKENPDPIVGIEGIEAVRKVIGDIPLVAIGGIRPENISGVFSAGADSAAIISALYEKPDSPAQNFDKLIVNTL